MSDALRVWEIVLRTLGRPNFEIVYTASDISASLPFSKNRLTNTYLGDRR